MWSFILTVILLCWGSEALVTCRNNNNGEVDWYILYKAPRLKDQTLTGLEYLYIDSAGAVMMKPSELNYKSIKDPNGILANTLRPLFTPIRSMPQNFGFISYSDQPPGCNAADTFGHSKGVVMVDRTSSTSPGVWLLHSTPQFPFRRDANHFWPDSGETNAQTFICVTFAYDKFSLIGKHLQYIRAFPFEHDIPQGFHRELIDAVIWTQVQVRSPDNIQTLTSRGGTTFHSFAKLQSAEPKVGDLYVTIAQHFTSDLDVQTWGCQRGRKPSYCVKGFHKVFNIKAITINIKTITDNSKTRKISLGDWKPQNDHSKWCVARDQNRAWTCIADVNRAETQYERRGGALCIQDQSVKVLFQGFTGGTDDCPAPNIIKDTMDSECEPGSDTA